MLKEQVIPTISAKRPQQSLGQQKSDEDVDKGGWMGEKVRRKEGEKQRKEEEKEGTWLIEMGA